MIPAILLLIAISAPYNSPGYTAWTHSSGFLGDWFSSSNWSKGVPTQNDYADIANGGAAQIASTIATARYLYLKNSSSLFLDALGQLEVGSEGAANINYGDGLLRILDDAYFRQSGGTLTVFQNFTVSRGIYHLSDGNLSLQPVWTTFSNPPDPLIWYLQDPSFTISQDGRVVQDFGVVSVSDTTGNEGGWGPCQGYKELNVFGHYELNQGTLRLDGNVYADADVVGTFIQNGGAFEVSGLLNVCEHTYLPAAGVYELNGGTLSAHMFWLSGGTLIVKDEPIVDVWYMRVEPSFGRSAYCDLMGGMLTVRALIVGEVGEPYYSLTHEGLLHIGAEPQTRIAVQGYLWLGAGAHVKADVGSAIHMLGADLIVESTDSRALEGLGSLRIVFEDPPAQEAFDTFEVAGTDDGPSIIGFRDNFGLRELHVGTPDTPARVWLVDAYDNDADGSASEALYVGKLVLNAGSVLDLQGLALYYLELVNLGASVRPDGAALLPCSVDAFDANGDGHINVFDFGRFSECLGGPLINRPMDCLVLFDCDGDEDTDLMDFQCFALQLTD